MTTPATGETPVMPEMTAEPRQDPADTAGLLKAAITDRQQYRKVPAQITMSAAADQKLGAAPGVTLAEPADPMTGCIEFAAVCAGFSPELVEHLHRPLPDLDGVEFRGLDDGLDDAVAAELDEIEASPTPVPVIPEQPRPGKVEEIQRAVHIGAMPSTFTAPPVGKSRQGAHRPRRQPVRGWLRWIGRQMWPPIEGRQLPRQEPAP